MIFDKGIKSMQWVKTVFPTDDAGETGYPHAKKVKLDTYLTPYTKINSKWIKDLNLIAKSTKLSEENIKKRLHGIGSGNDFMDMTPKTQAIKEKNR